MSAPGLIAHFNAARLLHLPGDARVAEFVDNTHRVNAVAERSKGFVWRLADEASSVTSASYAGDGTDPYLAFSMSVWETMGDFEHFVHKTIHGQFLGRRQTWFAPWQGPNYVLWNFDGTPPIPVAEGWARLKHLREHGNSAHAFDLHFGREHPVGR